ncbi:MAG: glycosyltransferase [Candidatus Woesearchaeota archaeon]|jgi:cellulose synthase/poly-beta-1,6-N-acetylglucosamine synthase-like glycosyltransferase
MNTVYIGLVYIVWFLSTYFIVVLILSLIEHKNELFTSPIFENTDTLPTISIIMSAYNEEDSIGASIESLQTINYPKELYEIIVVNDGSTDKTAELVQRYTSKNIKFINNLKNKGKAACLNQGIATAHGEFIACMDADSIVDPQVFHKTIPYFKNKDIGAVTITVEVKNPKNFLEKVIELEYILGLSLFLKIYSIFDTIQVTPGPFSIYRKSVLTEIGCFDPTNITEDLEIAYRIHKAHYKIAFCMTTFVKTIIPPTLPELFRQRRRWYTGAILTAVQHRRMFFSRQYGLFGYFVPFNLTIIFLGLTLFIYSTYLLISNSITSISLFALTNYNFWTLFSLKQFDPLAISMFGIFGFCSICCTVLTLIIGMRFAKQTLKTRIPGSIGFVFLFFLYQFFWFVSLYSVVTKRKIRW